MPEKTYKKIEIVGVSEKSTSHAIQNAIEKASESIQNLDWFEVQEIRGYIKNNQPIFQVTLKVGFRLNWFFLRIIKKRTPSLPIPILDNPRLEYLTMLS